jgi:hypothetical protein
MLILYILFLIFLGFLFFWIFSFLLYRHELRIEERIKKVQYEIDEIKFRFKKGK